MDATEGGRRRSKKSASTGNKFEVGGQPEKTES